MMLLLQIIGWSCMGHLLTDFISSFDLPELPDKPFKCDMCMTYWISVLPLVVQYGWPGFLYAGISAVGANYIYKRI